MPCLKPSSQSCVCAWVSHIPLEGERSMLAGLTKVVEKSSNTSKWILGSASLKGKWKKKKRKNSTFIKNQANYQASYFWGQVCEADATKVKTLSKWLWWVLPRCARDLWDSPLGDSMPWSLPALLASPAACQMCCPQHLANRSYCSSSELDIFHIRVFLLGCSSASSCPDSVNSLWWHVTWAFLSAFSTVWSHRSSNCQVQDLTCVSSSK